jgi:GntR family transcriptional regulator
MSPERREVIGLRTRQHRCGAGSSTTGAQDRHPTVNQPARLVEREARPGERLPPARDLAAVLGVNRNTVLRALRLLREEGLLEFRRGRGVTVAGTRERGAVVARTKELVEFARQQSYRPEELVQIIEKLS